MIVHLLESTLVLALAIVIAYLPRLAARTRYAIVFAGLMKFAIPSTIVPRMLAFFGIDLMRMPKGTILINALGPLTGASISTITPIWPALMIALWLTVAAALLARAFIRGRAGVRLALSGATDAGKCDLAALARACERAGVTRAVRLVRAASTSTPATIGMLRPIIVTPSDTQLTDAELETILTHECAHIARRDNLLGIVESIAGCALWFHPLVWMARRVLDAAREEACDAIVLASGDANVYVTALGKICGAAIAPAIAPRRAGISCIVSNTIKERMNTIMRFGTRRLLPHRAVTTTVITLIAAATIGTGMARALPTEETSSPNYKVNVTVSRLESPDVFLFDVAVHDRKSHVIVATARLRARPETWATASTTSEHETNIRMIGHNDGSAEIEVVVDHEAPMVTKAISKQQNQEGKTQKDTISIDLKDADIHDLMRTFAKLTNTDIVVDEDVSGRTTIQMTDVPWTQAFDIVLRTNNLRSEKIGNTIHVHRK
jgi:beta-lactamase regulating signal transducer with metallopeptidase domain